MQLSAAAAVTVLELLSQIFIFCQYLTLANLNQVFVYLGNRETRESLKYVSLHSIGCQFWSLCSPSHQYNALTKHFLFS